MKKAWLFVLFVLLACVVYAQDQLFNVKISPEQQIIKTNNTAVYQLSISNDGNNGQIFEVFSPDVVWDVRTSLPLFVGAHKQLIADLFIRPLNVNPGLYGIPIIVRRVGSADVIKQNIFLELQSVNPPTSSYLPAFRGNASMPKKIFPDKEISVSLSLENLNRRNLSDVSIKLRSGVINKDYTTSLGPREKKLLIFTTLVDKSALPQRDFLKIYVIKSENEKSYQYEVMPLQFEVLPYENIVSSEINESVFLKNLVLVKVSNFGNVPQYAVSVKQMNFFKRLFTTVSLDAKVVNGAYEFSIPLDVGEERTISITTNYRIPTTILCILLFCVGLYFLLRSPLYVKKTATIMSTKDGGIHEIKINLRVSNRSKKVVRNISLIDLVPKIAEVERVFDSSVAPSQIVKNDKKGTLLKWNIDHLDSGEECLLLYRIKSKFSIIGGATLPVVVAKFITANNKERTTFSNRYRIKVIK